MRYSDSVRNRLLTRQKSAAYSSSLRPQAPRWLLLGSVSSEVLHTYFSRVMQSRKRSKQVRKIALNTQLQGYIASPRPFRKPTPRHALHPGLARAKVSDLVHSISSSSN